MSVHAVLALASLEVAVLLLSSAALAFTLWRHRDAILYPEGVAYYSTAVFVLTVAAVVDLAGEVTGRWTLELASDVLFTLASATAAAAAWHFARDFIQIDREGRPTVEPEKTDEGGGFEDA